MGAEGGANKAPTAVIETLIVVRPIKVIGLLCGVLGTLLLLLSIAATAWLTADGTREGLWERCIYNKTVKGYIHCHLGHFEGHNWVVACQILSVISVVVCVTGIIITSLGLRSDNFKTKYSFYWAGLILFFVSAGFELLSLIVFPIKFLEEHRDKSNWNFGWAYIIGWVASISQFTAGLFLLLDRGAEEIIYREKIIQEEDKNGIEASEEV